ncbi:ADP-ribosylglycohydrolase family protein, partial [Deinococcus pimensis]|uniref:ADP-ribosylglycohydrolase family protein n=1 Tax=Deinococcus pimensis TaxID=309888 RepID=UPI0005EB51CB
WAASGHHAAGNGGLMKVAACNAAGFTGAELERQAVLVTGLTHADPRCVFASVFLTAFVEELGQEGTYREAAERALRRAAARD